MGYGKQLSELFIKAVGLAVCCALLCSCVNLRAAAAPQTEPAAGVSVIGQPMEVTVGANGQFQTLNEALAYCSRFYPVYQKDGCGVTIRILEGTTIREQIVCSAVDLSYITITADRTASYPEVPVEHTAAWTGDRDESRYNKPFLEANNGGRLPLIGCVFRLVSECSDANGYVCGMLCDKGSEGIVLDGGGFTHFFDGVIANNNSEITCRNGVLTDCGRYAAQARHISRVSVRGSDLSGAGQCAVYANRVSSVDARAAYLAWSRNGLLAVNDSTINANDMTINGIWGEYVAAADSLSSINCGNMTVSSYSGSGACFRVTNGSTLALHGVNVSERSGGAGLYSQPVNQLTGEGIIYVGSGPGYPDP